MCGFRSIPTDDADEVGDLSVYPLVNFRGFSKMFTLG